MRLQDAIRLLVLSAVWGGSFIFMRVAAPALGALATAEARVTVAALALLLYAFVARRPLELKPRWKEYFIAGIVNSAIPFALFCWAEIRVSASLAAILNATSPMFGAIVAWVWIKDRLTMPKLAGMAVSMIGIGLLVGWQPGRVDLLAVSACLLASLSYGIGANYAKLHLKDAPPTGIAAGTQIGACMALAPLTAFALPATAPPPSAVYCLLALAIMSTAFAYVLYFRLIHDIGPTKALTVTFLTPIFGVTWAALFLGEALTPLKVGSMLIVLAGTSMVTLRFPAKRLEPASSLT